MQKILITIYDDDIEDIDVEDWATNLADNYVDGGATVKVENLTTGTKYVAYRGYPVNDD